MEHEPRRETPPAFPRSPPAGAEPGSAVHATEDGSAGLGRKRERGGSVGFCWWSQQKWRRKLERRPERAETESTPPAPQRCARSHSEIQGRGRRSRARARAVASARGQGAGAESPRRARWIGNPHLRGPRVARCTGQPRESFHNQFFFLRKKCRISFCCPEKVLNQFNGPQNSEHNIMNRTCASSTV